MKLHIGQPTGHHGNYAGTLTDDQGNMIRGAMHPRRWADLAHVLRVGCRATGRPFDYIPHRDEEPEE